ncbi:hypothetical protein WJ968_32930 [Achromobacter xylosoxidans]
MTCTLTLTSCRNKNDKTPWVALIDRFEDASEKEMHHVFLKADHYEKLTGTKTQYEWDLIEGVLYRKGDTYNYSKYYVDYFYIKDGQEHIIDKRAARAYLKNQIQMHVSG